MCLLVKCLLCRRARARSSGGVLIGGLLLALSLLMVIGATFNLGQVLFQSLAACASAEGVWHLDTNRRDGAACPFLWFSKQRTGKEGIARMRQLRTDIGIDATPERVWAILTDFASYPAWNPFIQSIQGEPVAGSKLEVRIAPPDGKAMTFKPTVLNAEPNRELRWLGRVLFPRIFDGEHMLQIEPLADGRVRFVQAERF
jgi:hypothetical protein